MWICTNQGFISIVASDRDPSVFNVRARRREHLTNLFGPDTKIVENAGTDYACRAFIPREKCADIIRDHILNIQYTNFKDSVKDRELHDLYEDFWHLHWQYQEFPRNHKFNYGKK